jgi:hypothetical protein
MQEGPQRLELCAKILLLSCAFRARFFLKVSDYVIIIQCNFLLAHNIFVNTHYYGHTTMYH